MSQSSVPRETWALVTQSDTGVGLSTKVGGIALALRHARMSARQGYAGIRFVINNEADAAKLRSVFERDSSPLPVEIETASFSDEVGFAVVTLEASAIYTSASFEASAEAPAPCFRLNSRADMGPAQKFLYAQIRKSVVLDGVIAYYIMRPLARLFTQLLLNTRVSPNQATLGALACGIAAAFFAAKGGATNGIYAGALYWFGGVIDCIDGELARLRLQSSKLGEWLDSMVDEFSTFALLSGLGIGLAHDGYGDYWMAIGFGGSAIGIVTLTRLYYELYKKRLPIDTAYFPWFHMQGEDKAEEKPTSVLSLILIGFGYIIRRDANLTITAILLFLNLRHIATAGVSIGLLGIALLAITHYTIMATRKSAT